MKKIYKGLTLLAIIPLMASCSSMSEEDSFKHVMQVITGYQNAEEHIDYSLYRHSVAKVLAHYEKVDVNAFMEQSYDVDSYTITPEDEKPENWETYNKKYLRSQTILAAELSDFGLASTSHNIADSGESSTPIDATLAARLVSAKTLMDEFSDFRKDTHEAHNYPYSCNFSYDFSSRETLVEYTLSMVADIDFSVKKDKSGEILTYKTNVGYAYSLVAKYDEIGAVKELSYVVTIAHEHNDKDESDKLDNFDYYYSYQSTYTYVGPTYVA